MLCHILEMKRWTSLLKYGIKRNYYSQTMVPGLQRKTKWELQLELAEDAPPISGYNYVMNRFANMSHTLAERSVTKVLQVFPETSFTSYLGKVWHFNCSYQHPQESNSGF